VPFAALIARRYHLHWILLLATVEVVAFRNITGVVSVPGRGDEAEWVLGPLLPALGALLIPAACVVTFEETERVVPSPVQLRRLMVIAVQGASAVGAAWLGFGFNDDGLAAARNGLFLGGLSLCAAMVLPAVVAWAPVVIVATGTWIIGVPEPGAAVPNWALLLHGVTFVPSTIAAAFLQLTGALSFAVRERPLLRPNACLNDDVFG
jgi:hypothetical protein